MSSLNLGDVCPSVEIFTAIQILTMLASALVSALSFLGWRRVTREEHEKTIRVSWNKNTFTLDFKDFTNGLHEATVKDLKLKFKDLTNVPIATMNMKVSGAHIKDDTATLESVGVHPYCVVELSGELLDQDQVAQQTSSGNPEEYALIQRIASIVDDLSSNFIETIDSYENSLKEQQAKLEVNKDHKLDDDGRKKLQDHGIYCSERLMQALIRLDAVECPMEFDKARQKRRESVRFTQRLLDRVDILRSTARSIV
ncbi:hypothetical protein [Absidia glauca]|uniref:BAG domain-containing protein n=1 Tax=Absidia glauca TaxID=4829 RepID=A0A163K397_ABSGL|nr:hypothetical protein [Absidia glauca]